MFGIYFSNGRTYFFVFPEKCNIFWHFKIFHRRNILGFDIFLKQCLFKKFLLAIPKDDLSKYELLAHCEISFKLH